MRHRTRPEDAVVYRRVKLPSGIYVTAVPLLDKGARATDGLFARLDYDGGLEVARREGGRLISDQTLYELGDVGLQLYPYLGTPIAETTIEHSRRHDEAVFRQLIARGWDGITPVAGAGKHWLAGAPEGRSRLGGWDKDGPGPGKELWNPVMVAHNRQHHDDGTTTMLEWGERVPRSLSAAARPVLRLTHPYTRGEVVRELQATIGAFPDGIFGPATEQAVRRFQRGRGMTDTGVVDAATWAALDAAADETEVPPDSEGPDTIPTGQPRIITTEEWGARPAPSRPLRPAVGIVLHHMASRNRAPQVDPAAELRVSTYLARACQLDHASRGWGDTGQHFTVSRGGVILEGRVGTLAAARRGLVVHGAHAGPAANSDHWGIECEGTYHLEMVMTPEQWGALVELVRWLLEVGGLSVDAITPHNRWKPTGCPGLLVDRLPELRAAVR